MNDSTESRRVEPAPAPAVRTYRDDDVVAFAELHRANGAMYAGLEPELFQEPASEGLVEHLATDRGWSTDPDSLRLVAEIDGRLAGYLEASVERPGPDARWQTAADRSRVRLYIHYLGTAERAWRRGVATALVTAAETWGRSRGATIAACDTWIGSPMSVPFWERRMGYARKNVVYRKRL